MRTAAVTITFHCWWHAGSGESGVGDVDAAVVRDADGLPYLPGKTLHGHFRDAARLLAAFGNGKHDPVEQSTLIDRRFGEGLTHEQAERLNDESGLRFAGLFSFTNAELTQDFRNWARHREAKPHLTGLFEVLATTALKGGVAVNRSLRRTECTIPCTLSAIVSWSDGADYTDYLRNCARLIRRIGLHRHRGLGRCTVTVS